jgi:hypothetical protein
MDTDIASADLQRLFGVARTALNDLAKRGIVQRGRLARGREGAVKPSSQQGGPRSVG